MNVASLEVSKELYELSNCRWGVTNPQQWMWIKYPKNVYTGSGANRRYDGEDWNNVKCVPVTYRGKHNMIAPAYDLGCLIRKLPRQSAVNLMYTEGAEAVYMQRKPWVTIHAPTPEDALCRLAIELVKQGRFSV